MEAPKTSRAVRKRKLPARYQEGLTVTEISSYCGIPDTAHISPPPPPLPPLLPPKRRGRPSTPRTVVTVIIPEAGLPESARSAVVQGDSITGVLDTATTTVESTTLEVYKSEDSDGNPVKKTKRKAILKNTTSQRKTVAQKRSETVDFIQNLQDVQSVDFQLLEEGPRRAPQPIYPAETELDSPYALFSLFWTPEMFEVLATNTNAYALKEGAVARGIGGNGVRRCCEDTMNQRIWYTTNANELRVYIGILLYMSLHPEGEVATYWHRDILTGPNHTPALYMSLVRFTQLQRFLHIAPVTGDDVPPQEYTADEIEQMTPAQRREVDKVWWGKIEPLVSMFRENCKSHIIPGSNVAVDEMMVRFHGRSKHTTKMPNKPILKGYKIWALCEQGYLYNFMHYSRLWKTVELPEHLSLTNMHNVVFTLARTLPRLPEGQTYTLFLDNLFTNTVLFRELRAEGIGACGTTRPHLSPDFPQVLKELKELYGEKLPWGSLVAVPVDQVLYLG